MSAYDRRLDALEKDATAMKQDIIYKLDDTNSAVGIIKGIVGNQGRDIKSLINQTKAIDLHIDSLGLRLDGVDSRLETLESRLTSFEQSVSRRFDQIDQKFDRLEKLLLNRLPPA